ncbi:uncharacterized protein Z518_06980 [Rhinocladiella mackenziei CBS 650.93]|uniref:Uncharacterized protein n=1 Tax=Rhinocladiella mackenziei CBS 650.93 TaxID=1442369 RepID=A0A0D2GZ38_9EURO|nr:uncharacterized protein Z518_06980 [Rhinocladiella mackenziei CBS 650.93]KIX03428.1 hypothetical protein Z518_06980 [Rhinocladiella mackenziei CBS 650.93]
MPALPGVMGSPSDHGKGQRFTRANCRIVSGGRKTLATFKPEDLNVKACDVTADRDDNAASLHKTLSLDLFKLTTLLKKANGLIELLEFLPPVRPEFHVQRPKMADTTRHIDGEMDMCNAMCKNA